MITEYDHMLGKIYFSPEEIDEAIQDLSGDDVFQAIEEEPEAMGFAVMATVKALRKGIGTRRKYRKLSPAAKRKFRAAARKKLARKGKRAAILTALPLGPLSKLAVVGLAKRRRKRKAAQKKAAAAAAATRGETLPPDYSTDPVITATGDQAVIQPQVYQPTPAEYNQPAIQQQETQPDTDDQDTPPAQGIDFKKMLPFAAAGAVALFFMLRKK